jgi:hypothetical protein
MDTHRNKREIDHIETGKVIIIRLIGMKSTKKSVALFRIAIGPNNKTSNRRTTRELRETERER